MDAARLVELPPDVQLVPVTKLAAAMDMDPRKLRRVVASAGLPVFNLGTRGVSLRLSDVRRLIDQHEVSQCS